jgi:hypothetical protein
MDDLPGSHLRLNSFSLADSAHLHSMTPKLKPKFFGIIGVIAGFLALLTVLVGPSIYDALYPKPALEDRIADTAVKVRDSVIARLKGAAAPATPTARGFHSRELPYTISLGLAGVAIIGACVSYLRREDHRFAYVACGVGVLTLAWHAVLLALGTLIVCIVIFSVLSSLDLG